MRLAVVSALEHYRAGAVVVCAWPAAAREIDALASLADEVVHVAPLHLGAAPAQGQAYGARNLRFEWLSPGGGRGWRGKLDALGSLPERIAAIERAWRGADAVLVRCPSNAAVAAMLLMTLGRGPARKWVKYTGAWSGRRGERLSYRLQRWWLLSGLTGATVTVGGAEESPVAGAVTLCNPSLSRLEADAAEAATRGKHVGRPWRLLCAGRLVADKGVDVAIRALAEMRGRGFDARLDVAGDGPQRGSLEALAASLDVGDRARFHGWLPPDLLSSLYVQAHVLVAPSRGEGWSRAWTDAAAHRCVPVVSAVGGARGLAERGAGIVLDSWDPPAWADALESLLESEEAWRRLAGRGPALARLFTYDSFAHGARAVLGLQPRSEERLCEEGA